MQARGKGGSMSLRSWLRTKRPSRQGPGVRRRRQVVSPGGNGAGVVDGLVGQQGEEELAVEPGAGALGVALGQVAAPGQRFEALEGKLDLPTQAVAFEHLASAALLFGEGGEDDDIIRIGERLGLDLAALAPDLAARPLARPPGGLDRLADRADTARHGGRAADRDRPQPTAPASRNPDTAASRSNGAPSGLCKASAPVSPAP